jgi:hypothetical protein
MNENKVNQKVVDAVKVILSELNGGNRKDIARSIHQAVSSDHRTLQQSFWSAVLLAQCAYAENSSDLRNEQAVELAKMVKKVAESRNWDIGGLMYL